MKQVLRVSGWEVGGDELWGPRDHLAHWSRQQEGREQNAKIPSGMSPGFPG